eukprot:m.17147 g.17147  ORF g.17147 m.17147 type:complete len:432 (+) comp7327_c0_seq1:34-1329(+)
MSANVEGDEWSEFTGWLTKKGEAVFGMLGGGWRRRWCVMDRAAKTIKYYTSPDLTDQKGVIDLRGATIVSSEVCLDLTKKDFCFGINAASGRTFYLVCEHGGITRKWVKYVQQVCGEKGFQRTASLQPKAKAVGQRVVVVATRSQSVVAHSAPVITPEEREAQQRQKQQSQSRPEPVVRSLFHSFRTFRQAKPRAVSRSSEAEKLKTRVQRLLYAPRDGQTQSAFERSVVAFTDASKCMRCGEGFGLLGSTKANCRLCGDCVCDVDPCSTMQNLFTMARALGVVGTSQPVIRDRDATVPVCESCQGQVRKGASQGSARSGMSSQDDLQHLYAQVKTLQKKIERVYAQVNALVIQRSEGDTSPHLMEKLTGKLQDVRTLLTDMRRLMTQLMSLPAPRGSQRSRFNDGVHAYTSMWLKAQQSKTERLFLLHRQ